MAPSSTSSAGRAPCPHGCGHAGLSVPGESIPRAISESRLLSPPSGRQSTKLLSLAATCHRMCRSSFLQIGSSATTNSRVNESSPRGTTAGSNRIGQVGRSLSCPTSCSVMEVSCSARRRGSHHHRSVWPRSRCAPVDTPYVSADASHRA